MKHNATPRFINRSNNTRMSFRLLLPLAMLLLAACSNPSRRQSTPGPNQAIPVKVAAVDTSSASGEMLATGLISTSNEVRLSFKIGGIIEQIAVQEGAVVRRGQLLAALNSTEIAADVQQARLAVDKAQRDYQRALNLYNDSVVTLEQLQNSKTAKDLALQTLQQVQFNRQHASIYAPAPGLVVKKLLNTGEVAGPGTPVLVLNELGANSKWILRAGVADREWAQLAIGNKAVVTTDAFPGRSFPAVVTKKAAAADPASGSFEVELQMEVKGLQPAVGMFGKARITPGRRQTGYSIPFEALLEANGNKGFVFVTNNRKTAERVEVTIAAIENNRVRIAEGLAGYAYVVVSGSPYLRHGAAITITQ